MKFCLCAVNLNSQFRFYNQSTLCSFWLEKGECKSERKSLFDDHLWWKFMACWKDLWCKLPQRSFDMFFHSKITFLVSQQSTCSCLSVWRSNSRKQNYYRNHMLIRIILCLSYHKASSESFVSVQLRQQQDSAQFRHKRNLFIYVFSRFILRRFIL